MMRRLVAQALTLTLALGASTAGAALPSLSEKPELVRAEVEATLAKKKKLSAATRAKYADRLTGYLTFLGLEAKSPATKKALKEVLDRLFDSSTQFLVCASLEDWACLESAPELEPEAAFRKDSQPNLGRKVNAGPSLALETYFTRRWSDRAGGGGDTVAEVLAGKIRSLGGKSVSMALYGIDDIEGTMKPVYDSIVGRPEGTTRAVVDLEKTALKLIADARSGSDPMVFTYLSKPRSILRDAELSEKLFEYDGTPALVEALNSGIRSDADSNARLEWRPEGIMHNKFLVLGDPARDLSVWTGTANVSKQCMGAEANSNLAILIKNKPIAQAFLTEFEEMFQLDPEAAWTDKQGRLVGANGAEVPVGRFHENKTPNTPRYFGFGDGTQVRVHFSPTDDGEHRSILPVILSARPGDELRISMFGSGGIEYVRALQFAASRGVKIRVLLDNFTSSVPASWITDTDANLRMENPYKASARIDVRVSAWKGLNHHKSATLTRAVRGKPGRAEVLIVGSQNWSVAGNDSNDENMVTIRHSRKAVPAAEQFNRHFDEVLWPAGK